MKEMKKLPPVIAEKLFEFFTQYNEEYDFKETLRELYSIKREKSGRMISGLWYWRQALWAIGQYNIHILFCFIIMFRNYLTTALRNIKKQKAYSLINVSGLSISFTCCIFIFLFIQYETGFDSYHKDADRIYRITVSLTYPTGTKHFAGASPRLTPYTRENYPQVEQSARFLSRQNYNIIYGEKTFKESKKGLKFAEEDIFKIFSIPFKYGDPANALSETNTAVITARTAEKYFGDEYPVGKILKIGNEEFKVTGVTEDLPGNTIFKFNVLVSWNTLLKWKKNDQELQVILDKWFGSYIQTFVKLAPGTNPDDYARLCSQTVSENVKKDLKSRNAEYLCRLQPLKEIHLNSNFIWDIDTHGNIKYIYIFSLIGIFIFLIACFNFINLSTARFGKRACEIAVRKTAGAHRGQLFLQFIGESVLTTAVSFIISLVAVIFLLGRINNLTALDISYSNLLKPEFIAAALFTVLFTGITSGCYPAIFLSSLRPVSIIRGNIKTGFKNRNLRKSLVIAQFALSIAMISSSIIFYQQVKFMKNQYPGFDIKKKVVIDIHGCGVSHSNYKSIKKEFTNITSVSGASISSSVPGFPSDNFRLWPAGQKNTNAHLFNIVAADEDYFSIYDIKITAGKSLLEAAFGSQNRNTMILNKTAVKIFGWNSPEEAFEVTLTDQDPGYDIKAVFEDYHHTGLQNIIEPQVVLLTVAPYYLTLNFETGRPEETLIQIEQKFKTLFPDRVFEYFFLEDLFNSQYKKEEQTVKIFAIFTFTGIFIACLGLFGLSAFLTEQKTKEIGIRKALGASAAGIINLVSREFFILIIIANVIAWPVSYYVMNIWLLGFAYRIDIGIHVFFLAGLSAIFTAMISVGYQSVKAAYAKTVDSLKYE